MSRVIKTSGKGKQFQKPKVNVNLKQVIPGMYVRIGNDFIEYSNTNKVIHGNKAYHLYSYQKLCQGLSDLGNNFDSLHQKMLDLYIRVFNDSLIKSIVGTQTYVDLMSKLWDILTDVSIALEGDFGY